jgi:four helix bundle protein
MVKNPGSIRSFEDLNCWKACRNLRAFIASDVVPQLPKEERYRLGDQLLRAARSSTANIAEDYGRFHYLDNAKFCSNARGSCWEVLDHLIAAADEKLLSDELLDRGRKLVGDAVRLLNGYMNYLKRVQNAIPAQNTVTGDTREPITDHK